MPITIYILNVKENGHDIPPVFEKNFRDIRIWLISYFVGLGQNEDDIPLDAKEFLAYCSRLAAVLNLKIRLDELLTSSDPEDPIYHRREL